MSNSFQIYYTPTGKPQTYYPTLSGVHSFKLVSLDINYDLLAPPILLQLNSPQLLMRNSSENISPYSAFYTTHAGIMLGPLILYPYSNTFNGLDCDMIFKADFSSGFTLQILNFYYGDDSQGYGLTSAILTFTLLD